MKIEKSIILSIGRIQNPVITSYQFGRILYDLYKECYFENEPLNINKEVVGIAEYRRCLSSMKDLGILKDLPTFKRRAFIHLGKTSENAGEIVCSLDPFAYLSHLSAMEYHGVTDRIPVKIYLSSPSSMTWAKEADLRMKAEMGEADFLMYKQNDLPLLKKPKFLKIKNREINCYHSSHRGAFIKVRDGNMRVSSLGRTFLDMLRNPDLCGGMKHVVNVFEEHAEQYLALIIDEINQHAKAVEKVRAGYILEDLCGIENKGISDWSEFAQRGGSRKLDASAEYVPDWSEKWKISLNLF